MEYNVNRPNFPLRYRTDKFAAKTLPLAPRNVNVTSPYLIGVIDIRWDDPSQYAENNETDILGVNVYRSFDTPEGPYEQLNDDPIGALYYRDQTTETYVDQEDPTVGGRFIPGTTATGDWIAKTYHRPIIIPGTNGEIANNHTHVKVDIRETSSDAFVTVPAFRVVGEPGEIYLISKPIYNHTTNQCDPPVLPDFARGGEIRISYTYLSNHIQTNIYRKVYYKVSTVAFDNTCEGGTKETPLNEVEAFSLYDMEKIDWVWAEAIRRNRWILFQGGERVKVFIRKWNGQRCSCWNDEYRQGKEDCQICYGTSYVGGYEGPYDIIVAPPETEKTVNLFDVGLHVSYDWNTWTGPYPLLTDRDFVVRQNNERFSVARVNPQGQRGAIFQQHFMLAPLDHKDIRYSVPISGGSTVPPEWNRYREMTAPTEASPEMPTKPEIPDQVEYRGRTVTFENIVYAASPLLFLPWGRIVEGVGKWLNVLF